MKYKNPARSARSAELYEQACGPIPAGVNSTARAPWSGWDPYPLFVDRGDGAYLYDVDGNAYIDYLLGLGPMILGHRPPKVTAAVVEQIQNRGTVFALPTAQEAQLAQKIIAAVPSVEQVRLCNTGTEAVIYGIRLARAFTAREKVIRFEGMYHGFSDNVYWSKHPHLDEAGPDQRPIAVPQGPGMPKASGDQLIVLPWNDVDALRAAVAREGDAIAAILTEPVMCNTGCILPEPGYLQAMREIADSRGIVLIYDEVITGFRLGYGGAQGMYGIKPDISVFAKGLGGGFPVAALGGRRDIMKLVADGTVSMAGTYSANGIAVAAANAALDELGEPGKYQGVVRPLCPLLRGPVGDFRPPSAYRLMLSAWGPCCRCGLRKNPFAIIAMPRAMPITRFSGAGGKPCWSVRSCSIPAPSRIFSFRSRIPMPTSTGHWQPRMK